MRFVCSTISTFIPSFPTESEFRNLAIHFLFFYQYFSTTDTVTLSTTLVCDLKQSYLTVLMLYLSYNIRCLFIVFVICFAMQYCHYYDGYDFLKWTVDFKLSNIYMYIYIHLVIFKNFLAFCYFIFRVKELGPGTLSASTFFVLFKSPLHYKLFNIIEL